MVTIKSNKMLNTGDKIVFKNEARNSSENQIEIKSYKNILTHLKEVEKYYNKAAKYREEGKHEKAHKSFVFALGHCCMVKELLREDVEKNVWKV